MRALIFSPSVSLERRNFVDLMETVTYLVSGEADIMRQQFEKIFCTRGIQKKLFKVLSEEESGRGEKCSVDTVMTFILETSQADNIDIEALEKIQNVFISNFGRDANEITLKEFKNVVSCKDDFFVKRVFEIFDQDKSGKVSIAEFCEMAHQFSGSDDQSKVEFLFHVYDISGEGKLYREEMVEVIKACMRESGISLDDDQILSLASALFEDGVEEGKNYMTLKNFTDQLGRQEGLIRNLAMMVNNWLLPKKDVKRQQQRQGIRRYFTVDYWRINRSYMSVLMLIVIIMVAISIERFIYFRHMPMLSGFTPNLLYMFSRAAGKNILVLSLLIIVFVLRLAITWLRNRAGNKPLQSLKFHNYGAGLLIVESGCYRFHHHI